MTKTREPYWLRNLRFVGIGLLGFIFFNALWVWLLSAPLVSQLSNPQTVKDWGAESGIYDELLPTIVEQAGKGTASGVAGPTDYEITDTIDRHVLQEIFAEALPAEAMQGFVEEIIDGIYGWLEGNTATPEVTIDLGEHRQEIATALADYVRLRLDDAPTCTSVQLAGEFDPLAQNCLPPGRSLDRLANDYRRELLRDGGLLGQPVITSENFIDQLRQEHATATGQPEDIDTALEDAPRYYNHLTNLPWYAFIVMVLSGAGILAISSNRWRTGRWLSLKVALTALGLTVITLVLARVFGTLLDRVAIDVEQRTVNLTSTLEPLYQIVVSQLAAAIYWYTIPVFILSAAMFVALGRFLRHKAKAGKSANSTNSSTSTTR